MFAFREGQIGSTLAGRSEFREFVFLLAMDTSAVLPLGFVADFCVDQLFASNGRSIVASKANFKFLSLR